MTVPRTPLRLNQESQLRLMTKVARMYHERGFRQAEIARTLHISQPRVSRLLKRAVEIGIVRTTVSIAQDVHPDLEEALEERFGLNEAIVVDAEDDGAGDDEAEIVGALGSAAATYLETTLTGGDRIGISSWSQTLLAMVDRLRPFPNPVAEEVVQLVGGVGVPRVQGQAQRLLGELAAVLGAQPIFLQAPGLVENGDLRTSLLAGLSSVTSAWDGLTLALVGIGSIEPSPLLAESGNAFPPDDQRRLLAGGAVGDICYHFFSASGASVGGELDARIVSVPEDTFRAVERRVGVAGGQRKHEAVAAALRGGWVNVLITDVHTARSLLE